MENLIKEEKSISTEKNSSQSKENSSNRRTRIGEILSNPAEFIKKQNELRKLENAMKGILKKTEEVRKTAGIKEAGTFNEIDELKKEYDRISQEKEDKEQEPLEARRLRREQEEQEKIHRNKMHIDLKDVSKRSPYINQKKAEKVLKRELVNVKITPELIKETEEKMLEKGISTLNTIENTIKNSILNVTILTKLQKDIQDCSSDMNIISRPARVEKTDCKKANALEKMLNNLRIKIDTYRKTLSQVQKPKIHTIEEIESLKGKQISFQTKSGKRRDKVEVLDTRHDETQNEYGLAMKIICNENEKGRYRLGTYFPRKDYPSDEAFLEEINKRIMLAFDAEEPIQMQDTGEMRRNLLNEIDQIKNQINIPQKSTIKIIPNILRNSTSQKSNVG